jgi:transcriptional regulator with PAS, ATPase and Fis domain
MRRVRERIQQFARTPLPLLILGETGAGKDLCAHAIWDLVGHHRPFVSLNCAAIPEALMESELFGHLRGAFTGALRRRFGLVAQAHTGIIFLDEIAELSLRTQAKLLQVIETGAYRPVGGDRDHRSELRILAASSANLDRLVLQKRFRPDLLHRLGAVRIELPPLRERLEDVPMLVAQFLEGYRSHNEGVGPMTITEEALEVLTRARWPGNVRQLRNVVEAAAAKAGKASAVGGEHLLEFLPTGEPELAAMKRLPTLHEAVRRAEARAILEALRRSGGSRKGAAELLRVSEATLYRRLEILRREGRLPPLKLQV